MQRPGQKLDTVTVTIENGEIRRAEGRAGGKTINLMGVRSATLAREEAPFLWVIALLFFSCIGIFVFYFPSPDQAFVQTMGIPADVLCLSILLLAAFLALVVRRPMYVVSIQLGGGGRFHYIDRKEVRAKKVADDLNHLVAHRK